jgi:hypothetical protein
MLSIRAVYFGLAIAITATAKMGITGARQCNADAGARGCRDLGLRCKIGALLQGSNWR